MYNIFVMTKHNSFDHVIDLFILRGVFFCVCINDEGAHMPQKLERVDFFLSTMKVTRMELRSCLVTNQANLFIDPFDQSSMCSCI